jgi:hypothetical protein
MRSVNMTVYILWISVLIVIWWIAIWGLIEIGLKQIVGNSQTLAVYAYTGMILAVLGIVYIQPDLIERFI